MLLDRARDAWNESRLDELMACYAQDAVVVLGTAEPIVGHRRLRRMFRDGLTTGLRLEPLGVRRTWRLADRLWVFGEYATALPDGGVQRGTVSIGLIRDADGWLIASEFWAAPRATAD